MQHYEIKPREEVQSGNVNKITRAVISATEQKAKYRKLIAYAEEAIKPGTLIGGPDSAGKYVGIVYDLVMALKEIVEVK